MGEIAKYIHLQSSAGKLAIHPSNLMSNHNNNTIYAVTLQGTTLLFTSCRLPNNGYVQNTEPLRAS